MGYKRVLPRDLFNDAKVLKCMGQLALYLHDYEVKEITLKHYGEGFFIEQNPDSGDLYISNLNLYTKRGRKIFLDNKYNSKESYPIWFTLVIEHDTYCGEVFFQDGSIHDDFKHFLKIIEEEKL